MELANGCVADDAAGFEPVSNPNSLLSAILQGNFREMAGFAEFLSSVAQHFQCVTTKFPTHRSREIF